MSIHKIIDVTTGEETLLNYTKEEVAEQEASQASIAATTKAHAERLEAKAALLERLGITADEAALLLG
jgi:hypothetical protein